MDDIDRELRPRSLARRLRTLTLRLFSLYTRLPHTEQYYLSSVRVSKLTAEAVAAV